MSINVVAISGFLGRDPELRQTQGGMAILSLTVAVGERRKNAQGQYEDYTNWVDVTVFGNRAEALSKILTKGMKISVSGRLHYRAWEKDGQKRSKLEVTANEVDIMSRPNGQQGQQASNYQAQPQSGPQNGSQQPTGYYPQQGQYEYAQDDVPF